MNCICRDCSIEYDNKREYKTSICDECFKRFNEDNLQPLKDLVHKLETENKHLKKIVDGYLISIE